MTNLKERWKAFRDTVFDPWVILLFISTLSLSIVLVFQDDTLIISVLTFLVSLFSGVLGGNISKRWEDITGEKIIETRGRSANRSLQLLLGSAISLERRVRVYLQRYNDDNYNEQISQEVIKTYLEEIIEECISLEEEVINSIEDWTDILPDLEVKTVVNRIRNLKANYSEVLTELRQVNEELKETQDKSEEEINKLKADKRKISNELEKIRQEVWNKSIQVGVPSISGSLVTGSYPNRAECILSSSPVDIGIISPENGIIINDDYPDFVLARDYEEKIEEPNNDE